MEKEPKMEYVRDHSNVMNYQQKDYNNYQSWSNKSSGELLVSTIDVFNNIQTKKFDNHRLQQLTSPYQSFGDTNLTWVRNKGENEFYTEYNPNDNEDLYKKFKNNDTQHNEYTSMFPYEFVKKK